MIIKKSIFDLINIKSMNNPELSGPKNILKLFENNLNRIEIFTTKFIYLNFTDTICPKY